MNRKLLSLLTLIALLIALSSSVFAAGAVGVTMDGQPIVFTESSGAPFIDGNSRTLVPLRIVMEQYGCTVGWNQNTRTASVTLDNTTVTITIGQMQIFVNGKSRPIDAPAQIVNSRTFLPIRAVLEAFGALVDWDGVTRTVLVRHPEVSAQVHFIDVGQADSILILSRGEAMLIDAGNNNDDTLVLNYLKAQGVNKLKYVVGTHPHEDHIGGLDTVIATLPVEKVLMPKIQTNTDTFEDVLDAVLDKGLTITAPKAGDTFRVGDAVFTAVSNYTGTDLNNASIILRMTCGETSFLFTGDAEAEAEAAALSTGLTLKSDVLKVGHHGSSTSSSRAFLAAVSPAYSVISCGEGNDYGHPHKETLTALQNTTLFCTDKQGSVVASTNGKTITWNNVGTQPSVPTPVKVTYVLNTNSMKFHSPSCSSAAKISPANRHDSTQSRAQLLQAGYSPCGICKP